jgi:hypothetical protein
VGHPREGPHRGLAGRLSGDPQDGRSRHPDEALVRVSTRAAQDLFADDGSGGFSPSSGDLLGGAKTSPLARSPGTPRAATDRGLARPATSASPDPRRAPRRTPAERVPRPLAAASRGGLIRPPATLAIAPLAGAADGPPGIPRPRVGQPAERPDPGTRRALSARPSRGVVEPPKRRRCPPLRVRTTRKSSQIAGKPLVGGRSIGFVISPRVVPECTGSWGRTDAS